MVDGKVKDKIFKKTQKQNNNYVVLTSIFNSKEYLTQLTNSSEKHIGTAGESNPWCWRASRALY